jgi:AcrR family transcriptional regulator
MDTAAATAPPRGDTRAAAILLAAEQLFAQRGYHGVSIRQIADAAGVPLALVGYHFGPKQDLFHAVFRHWAPTAEERVARLKQALARSEGASRKRRLRAIVEAFVGPVLELRASPEGEDYARLVGRELSYSSEEADRVLREIFDPLARAFIDAILATFPEATRGRVAWCYQFALGSLMLHLTDNRVERLSNRENRAADATGGALLADFIVGGMLAVIEPTTRSQR